VGGGGGNAVNRMIDCEHGSASAAYVACAHEDSAWRQAHERPGRRRQS
jgi:cell division GTPase FtsZ